MSGLNLAMALLAAFLAGVSVTAYAWWWCVPFQRNEVNPFGILSDPPERDEDGYTAYERTPEGRQRARERADRADAMQADFERKQAVRDQARHDAQRKPRDA